jgi:hypothetical protein
MPPKKDVTGADGAKLLAGFEDKETKLLAAAFLSSLAADKVSNVKLHFPLEGSRARTCVHMHSQCLAILRALSRERCLTESQYDYEVMANLTGNTAGSLKKMWPPVKKKAIEAHPSFATFLGTDGANISAPTTAAGSRKRKAAADNDVEDADPKSAADKSENTDKTDSKVETKKKAPAKGKGRPAKKSKKEVKDEEDSADGGDGLG